MWHFLFQCIDATTHKRANMMSDMHLRNLRQKMMIEKKMEEANKRLESTKVLQLSSTYLPLVN